MSHLSTKKTLTWSRKQWKNSVANWVCFDNCWCDWCIWVQSKYFSRIVAIEAMNVLNEMSYILSRRNVIVTTLRELEKYIKERYSNTRRIHIWRSLLLILNWKEKANIYLVIFIKNLWCVIITQDNTD